MWGNFLVAFNAVMPFLCYLALGWGLVRIGWTDRPFLEKLNKLNFQAFFPFLMFYNLYSVTPENMPSARLIGMTVISVLAVIGVLLWVVPRVVAEYARRGVSIQGIFRSNFLLYGVGLTQFVYGTERAAVASMLVVIVVSIFNISAVVVLEHYRGGGKTSPGQLLLGLAKNPLLQGCVLGLVAFAIRLRLPVFLEKPVSALAGLATPLAMISLGGTLQFAALRKNRRPILAVLGIKLVALPVVMLGIAYAIGLRGVELFLVLMVYGTPVAAASYPMAANMGGDGELAGQLVFVSTVASLGTIFGFIFVLSHLGLLGL